MSTTRRDFIKSFGYLVVGVAAMLFTVCVAAMLLPHSPAFATPTPGSMASSSRGHVTSAGTP